MMRLMMDERKRYDNEITAERRRHDEELAEECQVRAREADERMNVMMRQMETLERLAAGAGVREPAARGGALGVGKPRLTKLGERDDIEAYLRTFERMMAVFEVERGQWSYMLAPQLTGKAQKAFAALEDGAAGDYDALKAAILKRYGINEEAYRQRLRGLKKQSDESYRELATRAMETSTKWLQDYGTREEVTEAVTTEQLLNEMPGELKMWVREMKPRTSANISIFISFSGLQTSPISSLLLITGPQAHTLVLASCFVSFSSF